MTEQELYQIVRREIDVRASIDPAFRQAQRNIDNGNGDFTDSAQCSRFLSKFLGEQLAKHILELPPDEGRSELCQQLLKDFFDELSQRFERVQSRLDRQNGVGLATVEPDFPAERVQNVAGSLNDTTVSDETIQRRCRNAVSNVANSMHDDFIWTNAEFRRKAGFFVEITRTTGAKACKWCQDVSGTFIGDYNNKALRQVFRRHDKCSCVITYYYKRYSASKNIVETTRVTLSGTTTTWEGQEQYEISELSKYQPTRYTLEQAEAIERKGLAKLGFIKEGEKIVYNKVKAEEYLEGLTTGENGGRIKLADSSQYEIEIHNDTIEKLEKIVVYENDTINQIVLQQAKELLTEAQQYPLGTEIGKIIPLDLPNSNVKTLVGKNGDHTVNLGLCEVPSITMHNHPSGETFSKGDISRFVSDENARAMYVIGNNGKWYALRKKEGFNWVEFQMKTFKISKDPNFAEKVLKDAENYGFTYYQKS